MIDKEEDLIDNKKKPIVLKEMVTITEDKDDQNIVEENNEETTENPQKDEEKNKLNDDTEQSDKDEISSKESAPIEKTEIEAILLVLNSYWISLIGSISLIITIIVYEVIIIKTLLIFQKGKFSERFEDLVKFIVKKLGFKWAFFMRIGPHLSVGFFCLTTFSTIMEKTKNKKKFYILGLIQIVLYYALTVIILKVFIDYLLKKFIHDAIENHIKKEEEDSKVYDFFYSQVDKLKPIIAGLLGIFNTFLEKIVFGTMYIFLFNNPKYFEGKKMIYFRLLSLVPILYMIISLILRGLYNHIDEETNKRTLNINEYVLPILLGQKITIYVFFISTLFIIKYLSIKYDVFDEEGDIKPRVFTKIGSRVFGIMGIIELIIGLFLPSWAKYGIGGTYLLVLCTPIMVLYDYKKKYELRCKCKKNEDMSFKIKLIVLIFGWLIVVIIGIIILFLFVIVFLGDFEIIYTFVKKNLGFAIQIMDLFL